MEAKKTFPLHYIRKGGVVWLKVGVVQGILMKRTPLMRVLDPCREDSYILINRSETLHETLIIPSEASFMITFY